MNDRFPRLCGNIIASAAVVFVLFVLFIFAVAISRALL